MNEPEILEAYSRLSTPTSAPEDVLEEVERRIARRRTARRAVSGVAVLALAGGIGYATLGGDDGKERQVAADPGTSESSTLTYTDTDGSTHTFDAADVEVSCPVPTQDDNFRQHLQLTSTGGKKPVLYVDVVVDKVTPGQVFDLPYDVNGGSAKLPLIFFFTNGHDDDSNELSSVEPGATGTITVHEASCDLLASLWIEIDGVLGSEVEQPALAITGEYHS